MWSVDRIQETLFLKNHTQNVEEKLFPNPFLNNRNWSYLWINSLKFYAVCFYCMPSWILPNHIETKLQNICFYLKKKRSETSLPASFLGWFLKKISSVIFYYLTKFRCLVSFTSWDIDHYVYCNCLLTRLWRHKILKSTYLSNQAVFLYDQKVTTKI